MLVPKQKGPQGQTTLEYSILVVAVIIVLFAFLFGPQWGPVALLIKQNNPEALSCEPVFNSDGNRIGCNEHQNFQNGLTKLYTHAVWMLLRSESKIKRNLGQ